MLFRSKVAEEKKAQAAEKEKDENSTAKAVKKIKDSQEKSTLGDISALANLKNSMEGDNNA